MLNSAMKRLPLLIAAASCLLASCQSDEPKKKKPVPPPGTGEYSNIGWNRPTKSESAGRFGGMMPQSR